MSVNCRDFNMSKPGRRDVLVRVIYRRSASAMARCVKRVYPRHKVEAGTRGICFPVSQYLYHIFLSGSGSKLREVLSHEIEHAVAHKFQRQKWRCEGRAIFSGLLVAEITKWPRTRKSAGKV